MTVDKEKFQAAALQARADISDRLGDAWWFLLVRGLLALALGVVAIFWPGATLVFLIRLIAIYALIDGVLGVVGAFRTREVGASLLPGVVSVLAGLVLLFWPEGTGRLLLIVLGLWALVQGVLMFLAGFQTDAADPDRSPTMAIGAAAAVIGLVVMLWPGTGVVTISWLIGIAALMVGVLLVSLALRLRGVDKRVEDLGER
jgi:uncharacterized membrane protein HdeD (DUF308 family)